jgi:quinol monooxygenase YgiN
MHIVHVLVHVKPEAVQAFQMSSAENARHSVQEPGIARFDVIQQQSDPTRFVLVEVYRTADDPARHKETEHYAVWRDAVAPMMAEPRTSILYRNVYPDEDRWG